MDYSRSTEYRYNRWPKLMPKRRQSKSEIFIVHDSDSESEDDEVHYSPIIPDSDPEAPEELNDRRKRRKFVDLKDIKVETQNEKEQVCTEHARAAKSETEMQMIERETAQTIPDKEEIKEITEEVIVEIKTEGKEKAVEKGEKEEKEAKEEKAEKTQDKAQDKAEDITEEKSEEKAGDKILNETKSNQSDNTGNVDLLKKGKKRKRCIIM